MTQEEIQELKEGLKHKWDLINRKFQNYAHITKIDTVGLKRKFGFLKEKKLKNEKGKKIMRKNCKR